MNEDLTIDLVQGVLGKFLFTPRMSNWDSFRCHVTDTINGELTSSKIDPIIAPGGCTTYLQGPDAVWNRLFKDKVTAKSD